MKRESCKEKETTVSYDNPFEPENSVSIDSIKKAEALQVELMEKDEQLRDAELLIGNLTDAVNNAAQAVKVLNLKITEQETMIMKLNNGIVKAVNINTFKNKLVS